MTGMLGHVPAGEAVALMWRDLTLLAGAPQGGTVIFLAIVGVPVVGVAQWCRGRRLAWVPLAVSGCMVVAWFCFYAYSVGDGKATVALFVMVGWATVVVAESVHRVTRAS